MQKSVFHMLTMAVIHMAEIINFSDDCLRHQPVINLCYTKIQTIFRKRSDFSDKGLMATAMTTWPMVAVTLNAESGSGAPKILFKCLRYRTWAPLGF